MQSTQRQTVRKEIKREARVALTSESRVFFFSFILHSLHLWTNKRLVCQKIRAVYAYSCLSMTRKKRGFCNWFNLVAAIWIIISEIFLHGEFDKRNFAFHFSFYFFSLFLFSAICKFRLMQQREYSMLSTLLLFYCPKYELSWIFCSLFQCYCYVSFLFLNFFEIEFRLQKSRTWCESACFYMIALSINLVEIFMYKMRFALSKYSHGWHNDDVFFFLTKQLIERRNKQKKNQKKYIKTNRFIIFCLRWLCTLFWFFSLFTFLIEFK